MAKKGRPEKYTTELADNICQEIATTSKGLRAICKELCISTTLIVRWLRDEDKEYFRIQYARAKKSQAHVLVEEMLELADNCRMGIRKRKKKLPNGLIEEETTEIDMVERTRLQIESRKWLAAKLNPKKYGEKVEVSGDKDNPLSINITGMNIT